MRQLIRMLRPGHWLAVVALLIPSVAMAQGNPIGPEFQVNTYTTNNQFEPVISADASGNFVIAWITTGQYSPSDEVMAQRYDASGAPLGAEFRVNAFTPVGQYAGGVASDAAGNFVVVWTSDLQDGSSFGVFARRYSTSGMPLGPEFRVNTYTTNSQFAGGVASDAAGNFVVTWSSYGQAFLGTDVFGQRFASSGAPLGPEFRINTYIFGFQGGRIASDPSGNFVVIWQSYPQDGSGPGIYGQRFDNGGAALGPEFRVNTYTTGLQQHPRVSANAGGFVVVWESDDGSSRGVFAQRYAGGAPAGPEFRVNSYTTATQGYPFVISDAAGNFVVSWQDDGQDGSGHGIIAQRFAASGAPDGGEFRVNTYTTNDQRYPALAADGSGNFIVTWDSQQQDGSGRGVFGQRYGGIFPVELLHFGVE